jgi:glycerophosphoryl diester phosphodiesterase
MKYLNTFVIALIAVPVAGENLPCLLNPACRKPSVIGHQGAPGFWEPRNSLPGFERAAALGADGAEVDVRFSSDGVPFVAHDAKISLWQAPGCAGYTLAETPSAELARCRLLPFLSQKLLPLADLLHRTGNRFLLHLDIKEPELIPSALEAVRRLHAQDRAYLTVSVWHAVQQRDLLEKSPDVRLCLKIRAVKQFDDVLTWMRLPQVFMVMTDEQFLDTPLPREQIKAQIHRMHDAGLKVMASGNKKHPSVDNQLCLLRNGYDAILSYDVENGVEAARRFAGEKK